MQPLTEPVRTACEQCESEMTFDVIYVFDADARRDLARACLADRIRRVRCTTCGHVGSLDHPLLVYRPADGGLEALIFVRGGWEDEPGQPTWLMRLIVWLYRQLDLTFDDVQPSYIETDLDGLNAVLCRSLTLDRVTGGSARLEEAPDYDALVKRGR